MEEYWHVILEALIDTAKLLPILFIVYYLIELIEFKYAIKFQNNKLLKGKASPVIGAVIGCIPQCGFSVVTTDLFTKRAVSVGALIAVYIATSDEAIPLMISEPSSIPYLLALIGVKVVFAIAVGYLSIWLYNLIFKRSRAEADSEQRLESENLDSERNNEEKTIRASHLESEEIDEPKAHSHIHENEAETENVSLATAENKVEMHSHGGCCHHHVRSKSFDWLHPLLHCLKISAFILIINIIFGCITHIWMGEEALTNFLSQSLYLQPLLAVVIGLIPNCASSVVLTQLFLMGGLSFGALVAGLSVNAGLGLIILIKQNKNWKENLFIFIMLIVPSLILGYALNFI